MTPEPGAAGEVDYTSAGATQPGIDKDDKLAKPNYGFVKRQKELAKKQKKEEKLKRKLGAGEGVAEGEPAPAEPAEVKKLP
jgi:hypothetical protein